MAEIERLADYLVLMHQGQVVAARPLQALQSDPALPLAGAHDAAASLERSVADYDMTHRLLTLDVDGGQLLPPSPPVAQGLRQRLRIAASDVSIALDPSNASSILNVLRACIMAKSLRGHGEVIVVPGLGVDGAGVRLLARTTMRSWDQFGLALTMSVFAQVKGVSLLSGPAAAHGATDSPVLRAETSVGTQSPSRNFDGISLASSPIWREPKSYHGVK